MFFGLGHFVACDISIVFSQPHDIHTRQTPQPQPTPVAAISLSDADGALCVSFPTWSFVWWALTVFMSPYVADTTLDEHLIAYVLQQQGEVTQNMHPGYKRDPKNASRTKTHALTFPLCFCVLSAVVVIHM